MEFSPNCDYLAVSYDSCSHLKEQNEAREVEASFIRVFRSSSARLGELKKHYTHKQDIHCPQQMEPVELNQTRYTYCVFFMTFSQNSELLMIHYQLFDNNLVRLNTDIYGRLVVFDFNNNSTQIKRWDELSTMDWSRLNFPNHVNCRY
jgi:hypothetical protein